MRMSLKTQNVEKLMTYEAVSIVFLEYMDAFPEVKSFYKRGAGSKDNYNASEIFPSNTKENVKSILKWIDDSGVKDLARVSMNSNILDDDDVHDVWTHVLENKSPDYTLPKKTAVLSLKPNSLYKVK